MDNAIFIAWSLIVVLKVSTNLIMIGWTWVLLWPLVFYLVLIIVGVVLAFMFNYKMFN